MFSQNRVLYVAVVVSVLVHAVVLSVRFGLMASFEPKKNIPAMELVLVNPLPGKIIDMAIGRTGNAQVGIAANTVVNAKESRNGKTGKPETVHKFLESGKAAASSKTKSVKIPHNGSHTQLSEEQDSRSVVFRRNRNGAGMNMGTGNPAFAGRPVITANTRDVGYAMYYKALRKRVENLGLINFPQRNGTRLYGELTVRIPVYCDGSLFEKEGGPSIEKSSGNPALDRAALNIIRRAAPFGPFPKSMRSKNGGADVWIIITRLKFTRDQGIQSQVRSTVH